MEFKRGRPDLTFLLPFYPILLSRLQNPTLGTTIAGAARPRNPSPIARRIRRNCRVGNVAGVISGN